MVRLKGLEPSRRETPDPKSGASANSATSASGCKGNAFWANNQIKQWENLEKTFKFHISVVKKLEKLRS